MPKAEWNEWDDDPTHVPTPVAANLIRPTAYVWTDPSKLPRRQWLYGRHLLRRYVSTTVAPGGLGKSSMVMVEALAMASGKPLLNERIHTPDPLRVWYWNGEDPNDESARRIQAAAIHYGLAPEDIGDRIYVDSGRQIRIKLASMARGEITLDEDLFEQIEDGLHARSIDVWQIDPFISSHQVGENDNGAIDAVVKRLGITAERCNCAIELVHHVRKPANADAVMTVDDARGASALIGGVRSARVLNSMTKDIAEIAKIDPHHRFSYFSVTNGKSNLGPRSDAGIWRKIVSVDLGNGEDLSTSDQVGVVIPFEMPSVLDSIPANAAAIAQDTARVHAACRYSVKSGDWFGHVVGPALGVDSIEAGGKRVLAQLIDQWLKNGVLIKRMARDNSRQMREYIAVPDDAHPYQASVQTTPDTDPDDPDDLPF